MTEYNNVVVSAIAAIGRQRQIGKDNKLLWHIPEDLKRFKELTTGKAVIMGRKTWESLPGNVRPLPNRENVILTRDNTYKAPGGVVKNSVAEATTYAKQWAKENGQDEIFIIGGARIYEQTLPITERLYLTLVYTDEPGDAFFPKYENEFKKTSTEEHSEGSPAYTFVTLERI